MRTRRPADLVVLAQIEPQAYAAPGVPRVFGAVRATLRRWPWWAGRERMLSAVPVPRPARVLVSESLLLVLSPAEQQAVLAHEAAHLDARHTAYRLALRAAVAVNPMLRPLVLAVDHAVERWADECAATEVGSRRTCAQALGRAALALSAHPGPHGRGPVQSAGARAYQDSGTIPRVHALLAGPPSTSRGAALLLVASATLAMLAGVVAAQDLARLVELAD